MSPIDTAPAYNLKVVLNETGIKPDTLRAWERRYGLPRPARTEGGHRLYSQFDIETIKWLQARQAEGLSISRAVKLWQNLEAGEESPLEAIAYLQKPAPATQASAVGPAGQSLVDSRVDWVTACLNFDEAAAEEVLTRAFSVYPPETVCVEVMQRGVARMGELWYLDQATVQQEHFASALALRRLNALLAGAPKPTRSGRLLIACPPDEHHTFAPLLLTLLLRYRGREVLYLGENVPVARMEATLGSTEPQMVILTAQQLHTAASLLDMAGPILQQKCVLAYGGLVFNRVPDLRARVPGHFLGQSLEASLGSVETLMRLRPPAPDVKPVAAEYIQALNQFRQNQAALEAEIWARAQGRGLSYEHFKNANMHLARDIVAALRLGNVDYLGSEIAWIERLLINYKIPSALLKQYLKTYYEAAEQILNRRGAPIVDWLSRVSQNGF